MRRPPRTTCARLCRASSDLASRRLLTAQGGGEVLHLLWPAIDLDTGLWTKAFQFRKRKPTDMHQRAHLVPLAPMAVAVLRKLKEYHERERVRKNAEYGGTWNGKKYGGWPREHISDWVFPSRTNPANAMANFFGKEDAVMKALAKVEDFDPHDLRRTASTWANATCPSPWVDRLLDHEIGVFRVPTTCMTTSSRNGMWPTRSRTRYVKRSG
jgi:integrase